MSFGQIVLGPPGSGKTTYCTGMKQFLKALGRKVAIINLDPANDILPYNAAIDIRTLIILETVTEKFHLGPNGALMYCIEYLEKNVDWLQSQLSEIQDHYMLFDFPGQVELHTHHHGIRNLVNYLSKRGHRLTCVHLVDSYYCNSPFTYVSAVLVSLSTMLQLELPHVNVFSKIDLVEKFGRLDFNLEFYADATNLSHLVYALDKTGPQTERFKKLTEALCELIEDFSLVSFTTLSIQDRQSVAELVRLIDKTNGYIYTNESSNEVLEMACVADVDFEYHRIQAVQEKYMSHVDEMFNISDEDETEGGQ